MTKDTPDDIFSLVTKFSFTYEQLLPIALIWHERLLSWNCISVITLKLIKCPGLYCTII